MNTLITFLNVASVMWLAWFFLDLVFTYNKAKRLSRYRGEYNITVHRFAFGLTFAAVTWLITGHIESLEEIEPQTTVEIQISDTGDAPALLIFEEEFNERTK